MKTFHPSYIRLNHFFLSLFLSFFLSLFLRWNISENIPCNGRWFPPCHRCRCDLNSERFAEFYFWFLRRSALITAPGRMSAASTLTPACRSLSFRTLDQFFNDPYRIFFDSSFPVQFLNRFQARLILRFIFSRNRKGTRSFSLLSVDYCRIEATSRFGRDSWKRKETFELSNCSRAFQIIQYIFWEILGKFWKWNFYPYFSVAYRCHVLKCKSVKWKMSVACRVTITSPYKLEIGD